MRAPIFHFLLGTWLAAAGCASPRLPAAATATAASYPEGPVVTRDGLLYVEFSRDRVMRWRDAVAQEVWHSPGCGPAGLAALDDGTWLVTCHNRHQLAHVQPGPPSYTMRTFDIPAPNDIAVDRHGGIYVTASGLFDPEAPVSGEIYYIDSEGKMARIARDIHYSNGIVLSQDGTQLHVSEHLQNRVRTYHVESPGVLSYAFELTELSAFAAHPQSIDARFVGPDGLGLDATGNMWVAHFAGGRLVRLGADGQTSLSVSFAAPFVNVTNVVTHTDGRLFATLVSDDAEAGHPGAVVALHPASWPSPSMHCTVDPPRVTCEPQQS